MHRKYSRVVSAAVVGAMALFVAGPVGAVINLDADTGPVVFAKETLLSGETNTVKGDEDGKTYYIVDGGGDAADGNALDVTAELGLGASAASGLGVIYEFGGMVLTGEGPPELAVETRNGTSGTAARRTGGAEGDNYVTYLVTISGDGSLPDSTALTLSFVDDQIAISPGTPVSIKMTTKTGDEGPFDGAEHTSSYSGAVSARNALKETPTINTPTATVADSFFEFRRH